MISLRKNCLDGSGMFHSSFHQAGISKLSGFILLRQLFTENNNLMLANFHSCAEAGEGENGERRGED